jgi:NodT family efflux transporter outer membrane factor (OMF) lipoprotein
LTGCAVGPQYAKPPLQVNPNWSVPSGPQVSAQSAADNAWWKAFNDPTLEQLIQLAYGQNLPLQVAGLRILENRALLSIAIGNQYPQLQQAFATASGISLSENVANNQDFVRDFADVQLGFDVAWEADFWRKFGRGVKAQQASYMASVADYQNGLVSLSAEVARNYAAVRTFETLIEQTRRNVGVQQESLRIADARFRNGATSELDVSQARTLVEGTRASIPQLEISLAQAQNALSTLIGQPPGSVQALLEAPRPIPVAPAQIAVGIPAEVLRRRPDIRSAELVAMGQSERIGIAKADLYPRFALSGTIGLQSTTGSEPQSFNLLSPASLFAAFGPRVYWPFFNYGRIKNRVRAEDARFQQAIVGYQNSVIKASQEVEDGIVGFVKAIEAIAAQQSAVNAALRSVELSSAQYLDGAVDFQRVLDAERSQLQEENTLARLRSSLATNAISLYKALGGGWEMSVDQPFVSDPTRIEMQERTDWGDFFSTPPTISLPPTGPSEQPPPPSR